MTEVRQTECEGLRIALVINDGQMGGSERQALLLGRELAQRGIHVTVLCLAGTGPVLEEARAWGLSTGHTLLKYPLSRWYFPLNLVRAWHLFRCHRPHVLLGYTSVPNLYAGWLWRIAGGRGFIWGERNVGLDRPPVLLERVALQRASAYISNSPAGMQFLRSVCDRATTRGRVVANAVACPPKPAQGEKHGPEDWRVVCIAHGRASKKDHLTLLTAWQILLNDLQAGKPELVLMGCFDPADPYVHKIRAQAESARMQATVCFAGVTTDVFAALSKATVGVLSSRSEGMPNAVLEYMAAGLPIVATDLPGIRMALGDDAAHWLVAPGDGETLAARLRELLLDPALRRRWGERNRLRAEDHFSPAALAERTWAVIKTAGGAI